MDATNFGEVLREARERTGEDIISVARRIRIRPDILQAIEASDLDSMPPRGYSRNMINAYARYLGLDQNKLVKMYQDAQYQSQVEKARANLKRSSASAGASNSDFRQSMGRASTAVRAERLSSRSDKAEDPLAAPAATTRRMGAIHMGSHNGYGQGLARRQAQTTPTLGEANLAGSVDVPRQTSRAVARARATSNPPRSRYGSLFASQGMGGSSGGSSILSRLPFVVAGLVVLVVVVLIVMVLNSINRAASPESSSQPINVVGLESSQDTTDDEDAEEELVEEEEEVEEEEAPTETVVVYEVEEGQSPYLEIQVDGTYVLAATIDGPATETFEITGTIDIVASPYAGLTITQDGEEIDISENVSNGIFRYSIDFQDVLDAWNEEQEAKAAAAEEEAASSTTNSSASNDATTSTSTTSTSGTSSD